MKVLLRTFGCRANHYDAEQVRGLLGRAGARVVAPGDDDADDADVAVLTSCAVTSDAEADLRQAVRRLARERPGIRVIVTGCAAARAPVAIAALPNVTAVIPGADLAATAVALGLERATTTVPVDARSGARPLGFASLQSTARATLRVQDGCDEHCTFCATTLARGAHRSRTIDALVEEAQALAEHHAEIVLTGIHVGSWGREFARTLGELVGTLVARTSGVRFRLASVEATEVDPALAELLRDATGRVCPYLHAPLQSGSDTVLRRMGRHWYTARTYADAIERLTKDRPVFGLGADVMTGFPGETDADHEATLALVRALPFTHLHVFPYSPRPGTPAERLGRPVPASVARARAASLRGLAEQKRRAYAATRIGGRADLVVLSPPTPGPAAPRHASASRRCLSEDYLEVRLETAAPRGSRIRSVLTAGMLAPHDPPHALPPHPASA